MKIVVLDGYTLSPGDNPWTPVAALGELVVHDRTPADQILARAAGAQILLTNKTPLSAQTIAQLPDLRFIGVLATGFNVVDVAAARKRGIPVSNIPIYGTDSVAQYVFALLLEMCHHVALHSQLVHAGQWPKREWCFWDTPLIELAGRKMGIVGFGRIGRRVGELAHAFGMDVLAFDTYHGTEPAYKPFAWAGIEEVFSQCRRGVAALSADAAKHRHGQSQIAGADEKGGFFAEHVARPAGQRRRPGRRAGQGKIAGAALDVISVEPIADAIRCCKRPIA